MGTASKYQWDEAKRLTNITRHGVNFADMDRFDWDSAMTEEDLDVYNEQRFISLGYIEQRLHVVVWTPRADQLRIISLRRADRRERRKYAE